MKNMPLAKIAGLLFFVLLASAVMAQAQAPATNQENVVKVLRTTNKAQVHNYVPKVLDFQNVNPHEVVIYFANALKTEEGGLYTFEHPGKTSGKILVFCPEYQIPYLEKLAKELDRPKLTSSPGSTYKYYRLKHRSASDLDMLKVLYNYGGEIPAIAPAGKPLQSDIETNSVLLFDAPSGADNAEKALKEVLDFPTPQVELEVKIYEVQVNNNGSIGLDYTDWKNGPGALLGNAEWRGERFRAFHQYYNDRWTRGAGYYVDYPSAYFDFLVVKNKARVVTESTISVLTNNAARFAARQNFLYFSKQYPDRPIGPIVDSNNFNEESAVSAQPPKVSDLNAAPRWNREIDYSVAPQKVGIYMEILPRVSTDAVDAELTLAVDSVTGYANGYYLGSDNKPVQVRDMPIVNSREFADRVNMRMGEETIIAGLIRERAMSHAKKMPILGSLPVIGWIFGGESPRTEKSMVVAVIKPVKIENMANMNSGSENVVNMASGSTAIPSLETKVGFDQWLLDGDK